MVQAFLRNHGFSIGLISVAEGDEQERRVFPSPFFTTYGKISSYMIPKTFEDAFAQVKNLVDKFKSQEAHYLSPKYQEAEVRQEFLDKIFVALGWDVYHEEHPNPYEREVRIEKSVLVQGRGKRADYAFYTSPNFSQVRFMVEAKKPSRQLENMQDCFQAIRYGWNSSAPISVLTDFEQLFILDSRYKPSIDTAVSRIIKKFSYTDFSNEEKFREIYYLFSREAVGDNSIDSYAATLRKAKGAGKTKFSAAVIIQPIDEEFLSELDEQRLVLAKAFKKNNPELDGETLTEITQRTLDRLVFLRFLEDKLVEPDSVIDNLGKKSGNAWRDFIAEMPRLNSVYNGTLFRTHAILDNPEFAPDERAFRQTQDWLAHENSPYDFNVIPIHILGSIYERFLGKTIETTDRRATVVDKPEVRKAGGVYYTPEYIVRYIVENTIGKLLFGVPPSGGSSPRFAGEHAPVRGKKPPKGGTQNLKPEDVAKLRFADIACGSGSFLLGVFDFLIAYHVEWFSENKTRREKAVKDGLCRETVEGVLQLTINYKREILLNNIYGVDLDAQAVEVAQFSLYLKLLEEETTATKQQFLTGFREQLLPNLSKNIVHGNSLIDYDIMDGMLFETRELKQLNPMNYQSTFPEVFKNGGFDAIVGNPPYGMISDEIRKNYFLRQFSTPQGRFDNYELFIEKAISLCNEDGFLGYIIPSPILTNLYTKKLRKFVLENTSVCEIVNFGMDVFSDPTVHTCILILNRDTDIKNQVKVRKQVLSIEELQYDFDYEMSKSKLGNNENLTFDIFIDNESSKVFSKLQKNTIPLGELSNIRQCIKTGNDKIYVIESETSPGNEWKPSLRGKSIGRYSTHEKNIWLKYGDWLARNWKNKTFYETPKIAIRETGNRIIATLDLENRYFLSSLYAVYPKNIDENLSLNYFLGIINSDLAMFYLKIIALSLTEGAFTKFRTNQLARLPIRAIDFNKPDEKAAHDKMVELVEKMLEAKKSLAEAQTDRDKAFFERYCTSLDAQIDALVYELYALTNDEIRIVEQSI